MLRIGNIFNSTSSYANVVSTLALFIALGGVSYAAVKLPANSVRTKHIKNKAVTLGKIAPSARKSLRGATGAAGSAGVAGPQGTAGPQGQSGLTGPAGQDGSDGADGQPGAAGATGEQGPQGEQGPTGPQGPQGDQGAQGEQGPIGPSEAFNRYVIGSAGNPLGRININWAGPSAGGASQSVLTESLAAGSYVAFANTFVANGSTTSNVNASCNLATGTATFPGVVSVLGPASNPVSPDEDDIIPLTTSFTLESDGFIDLQCGLYATETAYLQVKPTLTVIKVGTEQTTVFTP